MANIADTAEAEEAGAPLAEQSAAQAAVAVLVATLADPCAEAGVSASACTAAVAGHIVK